MEIKKCPQCQYTTDDTSADVCPECNSELITAENSPCDSCDNSGNKKKFTAIVVILSLLIVACASYIIFTVTRSDKSSKTSTEQTPGETVMNVAAEDIPGIYDAGKNGAMYIEFNLEAPPENTVIENTIASDGYADSSASEPDSEKAKPEYNGSFEMRYTADYIDFELISGYLTANNMVEDYYAYHDENQLTDLDLQGYVEAKNLYDAISAYDAENLITAELSSFVQSGGWVLKGDRITTYINDEESKTYVVIPEGIVSDDDYYTGSLKNGKVAGSSFKKTYDDMYGNETHKYTFYEDGNFIMEIDNPDMSSGGKQYSAGSYTVEGDEISVTVNSQKIKFYVVGNGITPVVFKKN